MHNKTSRIKNKHKTGGHKGVTSQRQDSVADRTEQTQEHKHMTLVTMGTVM